jgi:hypothetical protein
VLLDGGKTLVNKAPQEGETVHDREGRLSRRGMRPIADDRLTARSPSPPLRDGRSFAVRILFL